MGNGQTELSIHHRWRVRENCYFAHLLYENLALLPESLSITWETAQDRSPLYLMTRAQDSAVAVPCRQSLTSTLPGVLTFASGETWEREVLGVEVLFMVVDLTYVRTWYWHTGMPTTQIEKRTPPTRMPCRLLCRR